MKNRQNKLKLAFLIVAGLAISGCFFGGKQAQKSVETETEQNTPSENGPRELELELEKEQLVDNEVDTEELVSEPDIISPPHVSAEEKSEPQKMELAPVENQAATSRVFAKQKASRMMAYSPDGYYPAPPIYEQPNSESYAEIQENQFKNPLNNPLSTFSADVDRASYGLVRRWLNNHQLPPVDAVRSEELLNYFDYKYKAPRGSDPVSINLEAGRAPWNPNHQLVHIGIKAKEIDLKSAPANNLVFLIDVSGSMNSPNKLELLKKSFRLLVGQMRDKDHVSIAVYAGAAGCVLSPTSGKEKAKILQALDNLQAGGSTAGGAGLKLAYSMAGDSFIKGGNNRVILATDGDFNVGLSSDKDMERLITEKRNKGVFLSVMGFGMGNYKDSKMEILADKGNGNYAYIDNILEAKKVFVKEFGGTLYTVAKDVKLQVEFNPDWVQSYRLIGYENRALKDEDFNNDKKDAGEMGAGHSVTALYEIIPHGAESSFNVDPLKYQKPEIKKNTKINPEMLTVKVRYKHPEKNKSQLISRVLKGKEAQKENDGENFSWSSAVAGFSMLLRKSDYVQDLTFDKIIAMAKKAQGEDKNGYRQECIRLMETAKTLTEAVEVGVKNTP